VHCESCNYFQPIKERILIIKLGAAGDVIRTTPILHRLKKEYPSSSIAWLTDYPELLPKQVDEKVKYSERSMGWITARTFDLCYNLDKDREAIAIMERLKCKQKYGFGMDEYGKACALNPKAEHKLLTGVFNDMSKQNTKSYPQEIFEICGYDYQGEKYIIDTISKRDFLIDRSNKIIGFNTGCGSRWPSRLWPMEYWRELAEATSRAGLEYIWLGGPEEHERNTELQKNMGGKYFGVLPLQEYIALVGHCDLVVTQVTMTLHIALGMGKKVVLLNNIFNRHEFEMYDLGVIIEPEPLCGCYYSPVCPHDSMRSISPKKVMFEVLELLKNKHDLHT
jgi:heptosyltransferase-2